MINNTSCSDLISIIIPVYNSGKYLTNCLQSCINQTYPNIEIIIVDDHSTDPLTLELLEEFASKDERIRIIYCKENHGPGFCRNLGVKESSGKYFAFADSDDLMMPDFCKRMLNAIHKFKTDFVMCDVVKEYDYQSFSNSKLVTRIDKSESQFNLINAKDSTILTTQTIVQQSCLLDFPVNCYGKLFDMQKYRNAEIYFADNLEAHACQDQDWKINILIKLKNCLILKFIGYKRIVHYGSNSTLSPVMYIHNIAAMYRTYQMLRTQNYFNLYQAEIVNEMFSRTVTRYNYTNDFSEHLQAIRILSSYLNQCDSRFTLNPFQYSSLSSAAWEKLFQKTHESPLPMLYFSLRPLHDKYSIDRHYIRELFEGLAIYGLKTIVFNSLYSSSKSSIQQLIAIQKDFFETNANTSQLLNKPSSTYDSSGSSTISKKAIFSNTLSNSTLFDFYDNGILYAVANISHGLPEDYSQRELSVIYQGVQLYLERKFKLSSNEAHIKSNSATIQSMPSETAIESVSSAPITSATALLSFPKLQDIVVQDKINEAQTKVEHTGSALNSSDITYTKHINTELSTNKRTPRDKEVIIQPKIAMISGGDLVTQQVCRNLKAAGCKLVYLITDKHDLKFQTLNLASCTHITSLAQNIVPSNMSELIAALNAQNQADYMLDCAEINVEKAQRYLQYIKLHAAQLKAQPQKTSSADQATTVHQNHPLPENAVCEPNDVSVDSATQNYSELGGTELSIDDITDDLLQQLEEKLKSAAKASQEAAVKVDKIKAKCITVPEKSPVNSNYLFAPEEFDAVLCFSPQLAQKFTNSYQVPVESLGYVLNLQVNTSGKKGNEPIQQILLQKYSNSLQETNSQELQASKQTSLDFALPTQNHSLLEKDHTVTDTAKQSTAAQQPTLEKCITFQQPVLENGLAVFIKLADAYTKRHPDAKFLVLQDSEDNLVQALNKLHDKAGNTLAKLKPNLSSLKVSSIQKIDPIAACLQTKVLLKLGLHENASICGLPEALLNDIPVLASNQPHYAHLIKNAGKLLDIPHCTLQDPSCMPDDEEIVPYLEALEALMSQDMSKACKEASQALDFNHNADAWAHRLFDIAEQSYPLATNQSPC